MSRWVKLAIVITLLAASCRLAAEQSWFVVLHSPGPAWDSGLPYSQQAGMDAHRHYLSMLVEQGSLAMAGDFTNKSGALLLLKGVAREAAQEIVDNDPLVQSGVLAAELKSWQPEFSTMTNARKRKPASSIAKGSTFKIGSPNPEAPINLEKQ